MRSPTLPRRSTRKTSTVDLESATDGNQPLADVGSVSASASQGQPKIVHVAAGEEVEDKGGGRSSCPVSDVNSSKDEGKIQNPDGKVNKPGDSRSRSSGTSRELAICKGGPGRDKCGEPVKRNDLGVECDGCGQWYHVGCQEIPLQAYQAMEAFPTILVWLCPECKVFIKQSHKGNHALETRMAQLEKTVRDHTTMVARSLKEHEESTKCTKQLLESSTKEIKGQAQLLESSLKEFHSQKASYAEIVKGTCAEAVEKVSAKITTGPQASAAMPNGKDMRNIAQVFDDFVDKDRRKNNLVVHNLPEAEGTSQSERTSKDISLFQEVCKETFRVNVSVSRAFRVGRVDTSKNRLLIVTLDTPGVKQEVLKMSPQLRSSQRWGNIYITPDLSRAERESARKLREELASRRKAGENNLAIRRGRIVATDADTGLPRNRGPESQDTRGNANPPDSEHPAPTQA